MRIPSRLARVVLLASFLPLVALAEAPRSGGPVLTGKAAFGDWRQTQPPRLPDDVARLLGNGVTVYVVAEDLVERGLGNAAMVDGTRRVERAALPRLLREYDQVWHW